MFKKKDFDIWEKTILGNNNWNQNANINSASFNARANEANGELQKNYALEYLCSEKTKYNYLNNRVYIHDFDSYVIGNPNCLTIPLKHLLKGGFKTRQATVREPNSIATALQLEMVIIQSTSNCFFGGQSYSAFDTDNIPYIEKSYKKHFEIAEKENIPDKEGYADRMTRREIKQGLEGFFHNANTVQCRASNQTPFCSINIGYDTSYWGRVFNDAVLDCILEGTGNGQTSIFPVVIWQYSKATCGNGDSPNHDLYLKALKCTAKRIYPNYVNLDCSIATGNQNDTDVRFSTMGCRTQTGFDVNGLGHRRTGRGNVSPVTIILPTIAMESIIEGKNLPTDGKIEIFFRKFKEVVRDSRNALIDRYKWMCKQNLASADFMYTYNPETYAGFDGKYIESALKHGTHAIGILGMAECLQLLIGKNQTTKEGLELGLKITETLEDLCKEYKERFKLNFVPYATPAEGLCYKALVKFKEKYGEIYNVSDRDYFTNSYHVPVWEDVNAFAKIDIESQFAYHYTAGNIVYCEFDADLQNNIEAEKAVVEYAMEHNVPYFAINVPVDTCEDCGYNAQIDIECPVCGSRDIIRLRRITGYINGDYRNFNYGKQREVEQRIKHWKKTSELLDQKKEILRKEGVIG